MRALSTQLALLVFVLAPACSSSSTGGAPFDSGTAGTPGAGGGVDCAAVCAHVMQCTPGFPEAACMAQCAGFTATCRSCMAAADCADPQPCVAECSAPAPATDAGGGSTPDPGAGPGADPGTPSPDTSTPSDPGSAPPPTCDKDLSPLDDTPWKVDKDCLKAHCCNEAAACAMNLACVAYDKCVYPCMLKATPQETSTCVTECKDSYPGMAEVWGPMSTCTMSNDCDK